MGATILHGPHQGAQKSTTTGVVDCSTSCSNAASFTSIGAVISYDISFCVATLGVTVLLSRCACGQADGLHQQLAQVKLERGAWVGRCAEVEDWLPNANVDNIFFACAFPQVGQGSVASALEKGKRRSNCAPHSKQRYSYTGISAKLPPSFGGKYTLWVPSCR
jgi:hypothetical protein